MGLLWITQDWEEEGNDDQNRNSTIKHFTLEMGNVTDGKREIREALDDFAPYSPMSPQDPTRPMYVGRFHLTRDPGTNIWHLEVEWSTDINAPTDPLSSPMVWEMDGEVFEEPAFRDIDGKPYMTTAGGLIESNNDAPRLILMGTRNITTQWPAWLTQYIGAVNSDDIRIKGQNWPEGTLKVTKLKIGKDQPNEAGNDFCEFNIEITHNRNGWYLLTPNRDFYQLVKNTVVGGSVTKAKSTDVSNAGQTIAGGLKIKDLVNYDREKMKVFDGHGAWVYPDEPQMIDGLGRQIMKPTQDNIVILKFNRNLRLPFSALPLK